MTRFAYLTCLFIALTLASNAQNDSAAIQAEAQRLRKEWADEWRRSDSLRIASIHKRIKADSLLRSLRMAKPTAPVETEPREDTDTILATLRLQAAARTAAHRFEQEKPRPGQTFSDSLTLEALRMLADTGEASFYAEEFHGKKTSSGSVYNMNHRTCAHRWLPFGTQLHVTNLANNKEVVVTVTDRGPFKHGRLLDLSKGAARELDMIRTGTARVAIRVVEVPEGTETDAATETEP